MARPRLLTWTRSEKTGAYKTTNGLFTVKQGARGWHLYVGENLRASATCATLADAKEVARVGTYDKTVQSVRRGPRTRNVADVSASASA